MSGVYPAAVDNAISALISGGGGLGPLKAVLVDDDFTFDPAHDVLGDITGIIGTAVTVDVAAISGGVLSVDPVTFVGVAAGPTVRGLVFFLDVGDLLLCAVDYRADTTPVGVETNGGPITFTFDRLLRL